MSDAMPKKSGLVCGELEVELAKHLAALRKARRRVSEVRTRVISRIQSASGEEVGELTFEGDAVDLALENWTKYCKYLDRTTSVNISEYYDYISTARSVELLSEFPALREVSLEGFEVDNPDDFALAVGKLDLESISIHAQKDYPQSLRPTLNELIKATLTLSEAFRK